MGCGEFLVKYILFFANLFFALSGLALLGIGIAVELKVSAVTDLVDEWGQVYIAPIGAIVVGSIVFLIAFFGCCGAIRESNCMLITYAIFMIVLMVLKVTLASFIFVNMDSVIAGIPQALNEAFTRDRTSFQTIESTFQCCGTSGAISYLTGDIPNTCCASPPCNLLNSYQGCNGALQDVVQNFGIVIGAVAISVAAIELLAVIFALCLANHARNKDRRTRY